MTEKVRTTIRPDEEVEVSDEEATDLRAMGLLYEGNATTDEGAVQAVARKQAADAAGKNEG